ncbi:hypothetical protein AQV86_05630 [Nanohaloarchaea archaeon SG9]|nr:hypothetical protein AQV86_05630 [Nanohaloarchaea archaeon SG9]
MNDWHVTEVGGVLEEDDRETTLLVFDEGTQRYRGLQSSEELLTRKNYVGLNLAGTDEDPEERFSEDEIKVRGEGFYVIEPEANYGQSDSTEATSDGRIPEDRPVADEGNPPFDGRDLTAPVMSDGSRGMNSEGFEQARYTDRNFWEDVQRGMEELDDGLDDLAGYIRSGEFDQAVDVMERAVDQVGGYDQAREAAESIMGYLDDVEEDLSNLYGDLDGLRLEVKQAAQDLQDVGFRQDELDSMSDIQNYAENR